MGTLFKMILGVIALSLAVPGSEIAQVESVLDRVQARPTVLGEELFPGKKTESNKSAEKPKVKKKKVTARDAKLEVQRAKDSYQPLEKLSTASTFTFEVHRELEAYGYYAAVMQARDELSQAESALSRRQWNIAFDQAAASLQNSTNARAALLQSPQWGAQREQVSKDWWRFIDEVQKRIPEAIKKPLPLRDQEFMPVHLLLTCPIPVAKVPPRRACQGKWELKTDAMHCPNLACVRNKKEIPPCAGALSYVNRDIKKGSTSQRCCPGLKEVRVDKATGECKRVTGWLECAKDIDCPQPLCTEMPAVCFSGVCGIPTCPPKLMPIGRPSRPIEWPTGTAGCCLAGQGGCTPMLKEQCLAQSGREILLSECDKTNICAPTSSEPPIACCLPGGACTVVAIDTCKNSMNGTPAPQSSCDPNQCSPSTLALPPTPSYYDQCTIGGIKDYQCADGKLISWRCECFNFTTQPVADYYYRCRVEPEKLCPATTRSTTITVTGIDIRYRMDGIQIFWDINTPAISSLEYGETTAYGSVVRGDNPVGSPDTPDTQHFLGNAGLSVGVSNTAKLRPDTLYHYRIVATDTHGNRFVSNDYTFSTVRPYGSKRWIECQAGAVMQKTCVNGELVDRCRCTSEGQWNCTGPIESSCPTPATTPTPPATPTTGCKTGETKYYNCPQGIEVTSCKCTWEGKWDCLSYPEKLCPVQPTTVTPLPATTVTECRVGEEKKYQCADGTSVSACTCTGEGKWDCVISPEQSCPVPATTVPVTPLPDAAPPIIYSVTAPDILATAVKIEWKTDEPATSLLDYGLSSAYGTQKVDASLVSYHSIPLSGLQPNTTYHFRIIAIDAKGNKADSGDHTFSTAAGQ